MRKLGSRYTTVLGAPVEMGAGSGFEAVFRKLCDLWVLRALLEVGGLRQWLLHGYRNTQLCAMAVGGDIELTDEPVDDKESRGILREGLQRRVTALESEMEGLSLLDFKGPRALAEKLSLVDEELSVAVFVSRSVAGTISPTGSMCLESLATRPCSICWRRSCVCPLRGFAAHSAPRGPFRAVVWSRFVKSRSRCVASSMRWRDSTRP